MVSDRELSSSARHLRQSEVENLGVPAPRDENVRRLDVAMNNALAVRGIQRVGNFDGRDRAAISSPIGRPAMRCFRVTPSRNSIEMKARPSSSPMS